MDCQRGRFSGLQDNPRNMFYFFVTLIFLSAAVPEAHAATQTKKSRTPVTTVQQIGPAGEEAPLDIGSIYKSVPPNKALQSSTRFKVIDDFSTRELKNRLGGAWTVAKEDAKKITLAFKKDDARGAPSGSSLWARYNLRRQEQAMFQTSLEKLDMSAAQYLALKCQTHALAVAKGRFRISLSDWAGKTVARDITDVCREKEGWNEAILPLSIFRGVDLNQLSSLSFNIVARGRNAAGKVGMDEIAFFGPPEVGFESVQDNLKGFPLEVLDESRRKELLATRNDKELLLKIAKDTWKYFENAADKKNNLVIDHVKTGDFPLAAAYTSPTNIAMDLMGTVAARELGILSSDQAAQRVQRVLTTLTKMKKWKGFFFNFYETYQLGVNREFVSSVDNGWLAISLVVVRQAFSGEIAREATAILDSFNFEEFLDPDSNQLAIGYDLERRELTPYRYGMLVTEARAMSLYAIGKGDLAQTHWWSLQRTGPESWDWQTQKPQGKMVERDGVRYFQGYYKEGGKKFVPSWGGSAFEFFMPTMVIDEKKLAPKGLGLNDKIVAELQRDYALREKKYPVWGISPASTADGRRWQYGEYGIKKMGVKGYSDRGVITPHASFLALESLPADVLINIHKLLTFPIYGEYGFYDSVTFPSERVNTQYLALDQGMILIPIANYLKKGVIQEYFHKDPVGKNAKKLLSQEDFFKS
jgi:hypothetical protein